MYTTPANTAPADTTDYDQRQALFRAHARAVLCGDTTETARLRHYIWPEHLLAHHAFSFALFTTCVNDHFGEHLDWARLDLLTEHVRRTAPGLSPLKTEALIRACYDEPHLLAEVPQAEHHAIIWTVCRTITTSATSAGSGPVDLEDLFDRAEAIGRQIAQGVFTAAQRYTWQPEPERP